MDLRSFNPLTWRRERWASPAPFGLGEQRPNNYLELVRAAVENRDAARYAWRILNDGVCDGCALGTTGMKDWTLAGPHLCNIRLRLLRVNTMGPLDPDVLANVDDLRGRKNDELRELGRLPHPMLRRKGQPGFSRLHWDDALDLVAEKIRSSDPSRLGFFLTSRGIGNETYYAVQKAVRAMGTNSIDNAARVCHSPSTVALKEAIGVAATTCSYSDLIGSDLVVFVGSNVATNQPVMTKYLHHAKAAGTRVLCVNTYQEPGMDRYWVPSVPESAVFGTKITDRFYLVSGGGDAAFLTGALKHLLELGLEDRDFIRARTSGFDEVRAHVAGLSWHDLERGSGTSRAEMEAFGAEIGRARTGVLVWSMGVTQHACGEDNVRAIANLALAKGWVGRQHCGLMPIRGHSGVQGGAEMGAYSTALPGGLPLTEENVARLEERYGFELSRARGLTMPEMLDRAEEGGLDVLFAVGGNFREVMPDPRRVEGALASVGLRVHMDLFVTNQMLVDPGEDVLLLPATTRYEVPGGVTETSTERRVIFSPEIPGPRIAEARPEHEVFRDLAKRVRPDLDLGLHTTAAIRAEIANVVSMYDGIQHLAKKGDAFQYGGPHLCPGGVFPLPGGRARFGVVAVRPEVLPPGTFKVATRRGKQFNSMIHEAKDAVTGAERDAVFVSALDARAIGLKTGDPVRLRSDTGTFDGRAFVAPMLPGNLQVHWPEGNVLLSAERRSPASHVPDYNALVTLERRG